MPIAITKSIPTNFSPNLSASYWVPMPAQIVNLETDAQLMMRGFYDQAGYDLPNAQPLMNMRITIPAASLAGALASDAALGAYIIANVAAFSGGSAAEAS